MTPTEIMISSPTQPIRGSPHGVMANVLNCYVIVSEFELYLSIRIAYPQSTVFVNSLFLVYAIVRIGLMKAKAKTDSYIYIYIYIYIERERERV